MRLTTTVIFALVIFFISCRGKSEEVTGKLPTTLIDESASTVQIPSNDNDSIHITYSYGAGECIGYCETKFEIHSSCIVKTERGWASGGDTTKYPRRVNILPIDSLEYNSLVQSLNTGFYFLPDVIGCPDCNDGGWAEIIVATSETTKSISFPVGRSIPEIEPFLNNIKSITNR